MLVRGDVLLICIHIERTPVVVCLHYLLEQLTFNSEPSVSV
jgi:hypothetical protein